MGDAEEVTEVRHDERVAWFSRFEARRYGLVIISYLDHKYLHPASD
jgi:hypothetical protein